MNLKMFAALAGVGFGIWPLFMNKSGLNGNLSSAAFSLVVFLCVLPCAVNGMGSGSFATANWTMIVIAGMFGAFGMLMFNGMIVKATPQNLGALFVTMILVQTATPVLYQVVVDGRLSVSRAVGFAAAFVAAVLLTR